MQLRLRGQGEKGRQGDEPGDLYVTIYVKEHPIFKRDENDLYCEVPVPFSLMTMGGEVEVPTLDGRSTLKIPKGTASGALLRMRGLGVTGVNGRGRGDQIVRVIVAVPSRINKRQEELLQEFAKIEQENAGKKNWWEKFLGS